MKLFYQNNNITLFNDSMLNMLEDIEENSIDSIVCDPPYELNFMNKGWDNTGIAFQKETWEKCFKVLKPGGYLLAFGGSRTFHRIACAIEDAGFEIRDTIMWLYGSGFPKSMNIGLAIDKKNGVDNRTGNLVRGMGSNNTNSMKNGLGGNQEFNIVYEERVANNEWQGWGTCLKPAFEPIIIARKPFKGSLVDNVINNGVGGLNIDECRVALNGEKVPMGSGNIPKNTACSSMYSKGNGKNGLPNVTPEIGRFPANVILTYDDTDYEEVCSGFPEGSHTGNRSQESIDNCIAARKKNKGKTQCDIGGNIKIITEYTDYGSASRYFMNCKWNKKDEEIWKNIYVNNAVEDLETIYAIKDNIVQMNVEDLLKELQDHYVKYVENQQNLIEMNIAQDIVKILNWDFKIETSQVIQDFITNYEKCIQFQNIVQYVEKWDNIDTTQTTQNLLKLFGYVKVVITNYIQGNVKLEQNRYLYTPKASKKDRDDGLDVFEENKSTDGCIRTNQETARIYGANSALRKNTHPTVKPTSLMQYLVRLVTPKGGTILDPFMGSGSTGKATMFENRERNANYKFIGIELTDEYLPICKARITYAQNIFECDTQEIFITPKIKTSVLNKKERTLEEKGQINMFDLLEKEINDE